MNQSEDDSHHGIRMPTARREFIGQMATATVALMSVACATTAAGQVAGQGRASVVPPGPPGAAGKGEFDDTWTKRLTAKHRGVFDSPEIGDGLALFQARLLISGVREALGETDADTQAVVVLRHHAIPMVFEDALWAKYELGRETRLKNGRTNRFERTNPFREGIEELQQQGSIILGCNLAAMKFASRAASRTKQEVDVVRQEFRASLLPGVLLMPSGIYAVHRAQEAGCTYIRST